MKTVLKTFTILVLTLISTDIFACSCMPNSVKDEIKNSDVIIVGTIIGGGQTTTYNSIPIMKFKFVVEASYKGQLKSDTTLIFTSISSASCGYKFETGSKYIIYALNHKTKGLNEDQAYIDKNNAFYTTICTRTRLFEPAEIKEIEKHLENLKNKSTDDFELVTLESPPVCKNCGEGGLKQFIQDNLNYPKGQCVEGRVFVGFKVDTLGNVKEVNIKRGLTKETDEEAIRLVKMLTFYPGTVYNRPVAMKKVIAINFSNKK